VTADAQQAREALKAIRTAHFSGFHSRAAEYERGLVSKVDALAASVSRLETERETILAAFYNADYRECARLCDEVLDRSGALLGRVRALVSACPAGGDEDV
jgi:hypothetical protein